MTQPQLGRRTLVAMAGAIVMLSALLSPLPAFAEDAPPTPAPSESATPTPTPTSAPTPTPTETPSPTPTATPPAAPIQTTPPVTATPKPLAPGTPTITGNLKAGSTLTAHPGTWGPAPVALSYQWMRGGVAIAAATSTTYKLTNADAGLSVTIVVKGTKTGYKTAWRSSAAVTIAALKSFTRPTVTLTGTAKAGSTLQAKVGSWAPAPVAVTGQWKRDGVAIAGATALTYTLTNSDAGHAVSYTSTGAKTGYKTLPVVSAPRQVAALLPMVVTPVPTVSGSIAVGSLLTAAPGAWDPYTTAFTYQWTRNGVAIPGATSSTYLLSPADASKGVGVRVTANRTGYKTTTKSSYIYVLPACSGQYLLNGGFEEGAKNWSSSAPTQIFYKGSTARTGNGFVWLGGWGTARTDYFSQQVVIPAGCVATLKFWRAVVTDDPNLSADVLDVTVNGEVIMLISNGAGSLPWGERKATLAGDGPLDIKFRATENATLQTSYYIDDVMVTVQPAPLPE